MVWWVVTLTLFICKHPLNRFGVEMPQKYVQFMIVMINKININRNCENFEWGNQKYFEMENLFENCLVNKLFCLNDIFLFFYILTLQPKFV
jgi:hypothetical protein